MSGCCYQLSLYFKPILIETSDFPKRYCWTSCRFGVSGASEVLGGLCGVDVDCVR